MIDHSSLEPGNRVHEIIATVALIRSPSRPVPVDRLASLIDHSGSAVELVQLALEDVLFSSPGVDLGVAGTIPTDVLAKAAEDVEAWMARSLDVRTVLDPHYPQSLHSIFDRPPLVFVKGSWRDGTDWRSVAVVGTRKASNEGKSRAARLARELVEAGFTVVSGLAAGIDATAHQATLESGGRTVAVMGTGVDHVYPAANRTLADRILQSGGALVTQFFPHQTPRPWMFPARNVVMSGLSLATIVVEASETSGARMQARVALQHGRAVFVLRSLVESHEWARRYVDEGVDGARAVMIRETSDVVDRIDVGPRELIKVSA
jgi:DNA processing protein